MQLNIFSIYLKRKIRDIHKSVSNSDNFTKQENEVKYSIQGKTNNKFHIIARITLPLPIIFENLYLNANFILICSVK
jgi:hypothetical protein